MKLSKLVKKSFELVKENKSKEIKPTVEVEPLFVSVEMQDGSIEEYSENFIITDNINCVTCGGDLYHTSFDCEALKWEREKYKRPLKALTIKEAKSKGLTYCYDCSKDNYYYRHDDIED